LIVLVDVRWEKANSAVFLTLIHVPRSPNSPSASDSLLNTLLKI